METSLEITIEQLRKIDIADACRKSGADMAEDPKGDKVITLPYLGDEYLISFPGSEITLGGAKITDAGITITLLHYLITSKGTPLSGRLIDFRQIPDGNFYYPAFETIVHKPFIKAFGAEPGKFISNGISAGGLDAGLKDLSLKFIALPRVPVTTVIYKGDGEFPPDCKFLFDSSIKDYLSTEAVMKVCERLVKKLGGSG
ncbi:hypothetical protein COY52_04000 [Candidatus Desantisbacteria bacterium CG_4_10_14_0_8_um_filter_48_22]|uniref:DUF3786 domain-containing protein n=1 Tax=Candidatus Desantisbacteria bacterium CG_4_10_14_0_8_um_filter_48_22 TaxID=1974543 RepID=A0A2M7SDE7_9BACT|nr:MAG: hypothetical protein AUJ67_10080 [Candidatus Desantisbacteria bacterium CG1_02_49_89]PIV54313.1 MAG: hypothetical protein COS16_11200 [Candidatus Desantisbacteria bacterium CG02_land_8_20_14_3_00_49_13]PIZ17542.1 MAG: hypothetical protein COY52_04000 [Candidatus Desantisbacteria bacterium CG_4_10_14_0_8_um_filter_48_22]